MLVDHLPSAAANGPTKVDQCYTGDVTTPCAKAMLKCDRKGPLMVNIVKNYIRPDCASFDSFGRVLSGTVKVGDRVKVPCTLVYFSSEGRSNVLLNTLYLSFLQVFGEGYSLDDREDMSVQEVSKIWIFQGRYRMEVTRATAGNWVLFEGLDKGVTKTATLTSEEGNEEATIFRPLSFNTLSTMKVNNHI